MYVYIYIYILFSKLTLSGGPFKTSQEEGPRPIHKLGIWISEALTQAWSYAWGWISPENRIPKKQILWILSPVDP